MNESLMILENEDTLETEIVERNAQLFVYHYSPKIRKIASNYLKKCRADDSLEKASLFHNYYGLLKQYLPELIFIDIPLNIKTLIPAIFAKFEKIYFSLLRSKDQKDTPIADSSINWYEYILKSQIVQSEEIQMLKEYEQTLASFFSTSHFIKLSSRSPKDSYAMNRRKEQNCNPNDWMKCNSASEAMELLLTSNRVADDLLKWEDLKVLISPWIETEETSEFRCFICRNKLTAVTQYSSFCIDLYQDASVRKDIETKIKDLLSKIIEFTSSSYVYNSFVIDCTYHKNKITVIEMNPFIRSTGTGQFSWVEDWTVLTEYSGDTLFRWKLE